MFHVCALKGCKFESEEVPEKCPGCGNRFKEAPLRTDGPTLAEFVAAGYRAENYPPYGYEPR